ncbi:unnamed protein product [Rotaria sordida]|uniref:Uncharacterized protein n=1 Tax=Rotaria sordida TaxID=392033 RepID=A0A819GVK7_9BILA|nr:unnamed protein product [Rotaria sordida]CAF3888713.1 unnamed protein product [Rotaria sordida]
MLSMQTFIIFLIIFLHISKYCCEYSSCRTNCSHNGTDDDNECWRQALVYRSSELIQRVFSFSSLSVYVDTFQRHHSKELNDTIKFIDQSLEDNLLNESFDAKLNISLFTETKQILLNFSQNLTSIPIKSPNQFPSLSCTMFTCSSDIRNYMVLFIISSAVASLTLIICIVQSIQTRRKSNPIVIVQQNLLINSPSTLMTSANTD